jgi:L-iditol 2-dehydrogenase
MDGSTGRRQPPVVMGHEAAGIIEEAGQAVKHYKPGDRVTFDSTIYCGTCWFCRRGQINLCDNRRVLGVSCDDYRQDGAFAEYVAVPGHILYRLPDSVPFPHGAMIETLAIARHALNRVPASLDDSAVVVGAGMVGLLVVQLLKAAGCRPVIAVDIDPDRIKTALKVGADIGIDPRERNPEEEIRKETGGRGADTAYEVVGIKPTVETAVKSVRKGGRVALVGNISAGAEMPLQSIVTREITLYGSCASRGEYEGVIALLETGSLNLEPMISAVAPLSEGAEWFRRLYQNKEPLMKVILEP